MAVVPHLTSGFIGHRHGPPATISNDTRNPFGNGFWVTTFDPATLAIPDARLVEVYHAVMTGPSGSEFQVYVDTRPWSTAQRGDLNEYDPNNPMPFYGGQSIYFYFNSSATPKPDIWISLRSPK